MKKALFLDRDGVINIDHAYVHKIDDFEFVDGIFALCRRFQSSGYEIVVVTNQSGIGRGYYTESDFWRLTEWMKEEFRSKNVDIAAVYFCPHHPENALGEYKQECDCRKPKPGMILKAQQELGLDLANSVMVGDKISDMEAAKQANLARAILFAPQAKRALSSNLNYSIVSSHDEILP